ncbi:VOC family protein [Pseudorhodoferax sp.]|jgi:catechol 2,3-dioxygenase-like lactoylglutathione lyase family enzyme|uniref:VOC family protein n=1 Tax=Pseudorhodoferax sp. TaxID=1993553 RepID=UPI001B7CB87A|nr:VOC family protein [Pseudorhodoferax sp.]MBP8145426.1 VOC family protein [Inhella sp.]
MSAAHFILYVAEPQRSRDFYAAVLAQAPRLEVPGMTEFVLPASGGCAVLGLMPEAGIRRLLGDALPDPALAQGIPRAELYLLLDEDPTPFIERALAAGARRLSALQPRDWGHRAAYLLDPDGHVLAMAQPLV